MRRLGQAKRRPNSGALRSSGYARFARPTPTFEARIQAADLGLIDAPTTRRHSQPEHRWQPWSPRATPMTERVVVEGLSVAKVLHEFVGKEALPGTGVSEAGFWTHLDRIVHDLAPKNRALLKKRDDAAGADRRLAPGAQGQAVRPACLQGLPRRDRLPGARGAGLHRRHRPTSMPRSATSPGRSWWCR